MNEKWNPVKGYETLYEISNYGNVRNIETKKILKPARHNKGYYRVCLCDNKKQKIAGGYHWERVNEVENE